jgi:hypothetical protein
MIAEAEFLARNDPEACRANPSLSKRVQMAKKMRKRSGKEDSFGEIRRTKFE